MKQPVEIVEEIFSQFSREDEAILISLPYRMGLFVSFADTTGGWDAQEAEMQSLANILREFAEDFCKGEFSQKVLMESLRARDRWPSWSHNIEQVPSEAQRITGLLENFFTEKTLRDFKEVLMEIALAVAMAFRETDEASASNGRARITALGELLARLLKVGQGDPLGHINISANERAALRRLADAMNYQKN